MEEIRDHLVILAIEDDVDHALVAFCMNEPHRCPPTSEIETTESYFQGEKEEFLSILKIWVFPAYRRTPFVCYRPQRVWTVVPFG